MGGGLSFSGTATATVDANGGTLRSASLTGGSDAASLVLRTGGSGGTILCTLKAATGVTVQRLFALGVPYNDLHATVTGTAPAFDCEL
jgi:hypothetical protein